VKKQHWFYLEFAQLSWTKSILISIKKVNDNFQRIILFGALLLSRSGPSFDFFFVNRFPFPIRFHSSRVYLYFFLCCWFRGEQH